MNIKQIDHQRPIQPKEDPYKKIAETMEEDFVNFLIQEMRKSTPSTEDESTAENYYNEMLDQERAKMIAQTRDGIGLQKIILKQINPAYVELKSGLPRTQNE